MLNQNSTAVINELENDFKRLAGLPEDSNINYNMVSPNGRTAHKKVFGKIYRKVYLTRKFTPEERDAYEKETDMKGKVPATGKVSALKERLYLMQPFPVPNVMLQVRGKSSVPEIRKELEYMKSFVTRFHNRISQNLLPLINSKDMMIFENSKENYNIDFDRRNGTWRTPINEGTLVVKENSIFRKQRKDYNTDYMEIICPPEDEKAVKSYHTRCKIRDKHGAENSKNLAVLMDGFLEELEKITG